MTRALSVALCVSLLACAWLYSSLGDEREAHNVTRGDNARLLVSIASHEKTIRDLRGDIAEQATLLAERDASIATFNEAALDAAIAIQGAANDSPECNIDAVLPDALSQPLRLLYTQAAGRDGYAGRSGAASLPPVPAQAAAGASAGNDPAQSRTVDGKASAVGK